MSAFSDSHCLPMPRRGAGSHPLPTVREREAVGVDLENALPRAAPPYLPNLNFRNLMSYGTGTDWASRGSSQYCSRAVSRPNRPEY
jgi:hypothetical protein